MPSGKSLDFPYLDVEKRIVPDGLKEAYDLGDRHREYRDAFTHREDVSKKRDRALSRQWA